MPVQVTCAQCNFVIQAEEQFFGKTVKCPNCQAHLKIPDPRVQQALPADPLIGKAIAHYQVESLLGEGGMGKVYRAKNTRLAKTCALKILPEHFVKQDKSRIDRFIREAKSAANVEHPNVLPVQNVGNEGEIYYIEMQFVDGGTLDDVLEQKGKFEINEATRIVRDVAAGLGAAHAKGIVHRDMKPSNVMLANDGQVKVVDFGLAKMGEMSTKLTMSGMVLGTPLYMSPEQVEGKELDGRSDIYSLGIMFYQLLTGNPPYTADTPQAVIYHHVHTPLPDINQVIPDFPPVLAAVLARMTAKNPAERYLNCGELVSDLDGFVASAAQPTGISESTMMKADELKRSIRGGEKKKSMVPLLMGVIPTLIIVGVLAFVLVPKWRKQMAEKQEPQVEKVVKKTYMFKGTEYTAEQLLAIGIDPKTGKKIEEDASRKGAKDAKEKEIVGGESLPRSTAPKESAQAELKLTKEELALLENKPPMKDIEPVISKRGKLIFEDDFSGEELEWVVEKGEWKIVNEALATESIGNAAAPIVVKRAFTSVKSVIVQLRVYVPTVGGCILAIRPPKRSTTLTFAGVRLRMKSQTAHICSWNSESRAVEDLATLSFPYQRPMWCHVLLEVLGSDIAVTIRGKTMKASNPIEDALPTKASVFINIQMPTNDLFAIDDVKVWEALPRDGGEKADTGGETPAQQYVAVSGSGEKIPHPLSKRTYTVEHGGRKIEVPEGMVFVPAGKSLMGRHNSVCLFGFIRKEVYLDAYFIGKYEVTNAQYEAFLKATGGEPPHHWASGNAPPGTENHPVVNVSWEDAEAYCDWCGKRLPTEAEWEKAAAWDLKKRRHRAYVWGDEHDPSRANNCYQLGCRCNGDAKAHRRWYDEFREGAAWRKIVGRGGNAAPVGQFGGDRSPFSCFDMAGNVCEWVADWYREDYYKIGPSTNPIGPTEEGAQSVDAGPTRQGKCRVQRGGSWHRAAECASYRTFAPATGKGTGTGFRCAADYPCRWAKHKVAAAPEPDGPPRKLAEKKPEEKPSGKPSAAKVDLVQYLDDIKPVNERIDQGDYAAAKSRANLLKAKYPDLIGTKLANLDRVIAFRKKCFERVNSGKVKLNMGDISRRYSFAGAIKKVDDKQITAKIKKNWTDLKPEEVAAFYRKASDPKDADSALALAALLMEGTTDGKRLESALDPLGKAAGLGADVSAMMKYVETIKKAKKEYAEAEAKGKALEAPPDTTKVAKDTKEEGDKKEETQSSAPSPQSYDGVYVTEAATGDKIPHPLSRKTDRMRYKGKKIDVPEGMVFVPAGPFTMGSDDNLTQSPPHIVDVEAFFIDKYEVTNAEYAEFVKATKHPAPSYWAGGKIPEGKENHPVVYVNWEDATAYAEWCGKRLPTEAEWEKAAGWDMKKRRHREYPWGDEYDPRRANHCYQLGCRCNGDGKIHTPWWEKWSKSEEGKKIIAEGGHTAGAGQFKGDESFFKCFDMGGNVREWVNDWYQEDYYKVGPKKNPPGPTEEEATVIDGKPYRVARGGPWAYSRSTLRTSTRYRSAPSVRSLTIGFRCARTYPWSPPERKVAPAPTKKAEPEPSTEKPSAKPAEGYVTTGATGDKIPHPLSRKTYTIRYKGKKIEVPEGMVFVPAGKFLMGAGENEHEVYLDSYFIGKYEVTNAEWKAFIDATGYHPVPQHWGGGTFPEGKENHPVVFVSWEDAQTYCEWCAKRLPTEAEWEKAASWNPEKRAKFVYPWGNQWDPNLCNSGYNLVKLGFRPRDEKNWWEVYGKLRDTEAFKKMEASGGNTMSVGSYSGASSPYGCHDTVGNAYEWCWDWYMKDYHLLRDAKRNPRGPSEKEADEGLFGKLNKGKCRTLRGGAWPYPSSSCRAVSRDRQPPSYCSRMCGFRCVLSAADLEKWKSQKAEVGDQKSEQDASRRGPESAEKKSGETASAESVDKKPITVRQDGKGDFKTIQEAIDAAKDGDTIHIADTKVYTQPTIDGTKKKGITLRGTIDKKGMTTLRWLRGDSPEPKDSKSMAHIVKMGANWTMARIRFEKAEPTCVICGTSSPSAGDLALRSCWFKAMSTANRWSNTGKCTVQNCIFERCHQPLFFGPKSEDSQLAFSDNVLYGCWGALMHQRPTEPRVVMSGNIFAEIRRELLRPTSVEHGKAPKPFRVESDYNCFSRVNQHQTSGSSQPGAPPTIRTFKEWQKLTKQDLHSIEADPMFVNPEKGDFRLSRKSPCRKRGPKKDGKKTDIGVDWDEFFRKY